MSINAYFSQCLSVKCDLSVQMLLLQVRVVLCSRTVAGFQCWSVRAEIADRREKGFAADLTPSHHHFHRPSQGLTAVSPERNTHDHCIVNVVKYHHSVSHHGVQPGAEKDFFSPDSTSTYAIPTLATELSGLDSTSAALYLGFHLSHGKASLLDNASDATRNLAVATLSKGATSAG